MVQLFNIDKFKGLVPQQTFDINIHGQHTNGPKRIIRRALIKRPQLLIDQTVIDQVHLLEKFIRKRYGRFQRAVARTTDVKQFNFRKLNKCNKKVNLFLNRLIEIEGVLLRTDDVVAKQLVAIINNMKKLVCTYNYQYREILLKYHGKNYKVPNRNIRVCKLRK